MSRLGPFDLIERIGTGGSAEVFRALHVAQGVPAAIKVIRGPRAQDPTWRAAFRREARTVAGLDHPNIVHVLDYGEAADGAPWLAMELAQLGSLGRLRGRLTWIDIRGVLLDVLAGLAHAHARGVLHLDLKPANILLSDRPKLADFGIALRPGDPPDANWFVGTPSYMAPEQAHGGPRDWGPGTDLYGLGGLAWCLVAGSPPFGRDMDRARTLPRLTPATDVPPELEDWLRWLLETDPSQRPASAADAAWALQSVGGSAVVDMPPFPDDWRRPEEPERPLPLLGAGLRLYGLRALPIIDREPERDRLWTELRTVRESGRARAVILRGPAGVGKSRIAEWLGERAQEVGAARVLLATHGPTRGPTDGIGPMLARFLGVDGLGRDEAIERLRPTPLGAEIAVESIVDVALPVPARPGQVLAGAERHALVERVLRRLAADRPLVVRIEDAQWANDAIELVNRLVGRALPALFVLTLRDEHLAERPREKAALARLSSSTLEVAPLAPEHRGELVRSLLRLEPRLARKVEERTGGNPLFAVQLVGDWVHRGLLETRPAGFTLRRGARIELPDDLHGAWAGWIERVFGSRPVDAQALEVAAALGQDVDGTEWAAACARLGLQPDPRLVDLLYDRRLARPGTGEGWSFVHGMLRESLERRSRAAGRWAAQNRACAFVVAPEDDGPAARARVGRHLFEGELPEAAAEELVEAARVWLDLGARPEVDASIESIERAIASAALPAVDRRRARLAILRLSQEGYDPRPRTDAVILVGEAMAAVEAAWPPLVAEAALVGARILWNRRDTDAAFVLMDRAISATDDPELRGRARLNLAHWHGQSGRSAEAETVLAQARADLQGRAPSGVYALACHVAAGVRQGRGDLEGAERLFEEALATYDALGHRMGPPQVWTAQGVHALLRGDVTRARRLCEAGIARFRELGSENEAIARLNLVHVLFAEGRYDAAHAELDVLEPRIANGPMPQVLPAVRPFRMVLAADGEDEIWRSALAATRAAQASAVDLVLLYARAAERAEKAGFVERARELWELVAEARNRLGL